MLAWRYKRRLSQMLVQINWELFWYAPVGMPDIKGTQFFCGDIISKITEYKFLYELWTDDSVFPCVSGVVQERCCTPLPWSCMVAPSWQKISSSAGVGVGNCRPVQRHLVPCHCYNPQVTADNARRTFRNCWEVDRHSSGSDQQHLVHHQL